MILALLALVAAAPAGPTPPEPLETPAAVAPEGITAPAEVVLTATVGTDGSVSEVSVAQSAGPALDAAAMAALLRWRFRPAMDGGVPVPARVRVPFRFAPAPGEAAPAPPPAAPVPPPPPAAPVPGAPAEVIVRGRQRPVQRGASDYVIEVGTLAVLPHKNAQGFLQLAPGIFLANEGGEGHAEQVFLRGFNAEEGQAIEFTVGGVPVNEVDNPDSHGYADTHFIIPETVLALNVLEGPFDPHQGDFAVAGSAAYVLGVRQRGLRLETTFGSYGTRRLLGLWAPPGERTSTFGAVALAESDGFGESRASQAATGTFQYEGELGSRGLFRLMGATYATHYRSAGVVRRDEVDSGRLGFFDTEDASQGGDAMRHTLSFDLESPQGDGVLTAQTFLSWRTLRIVEDFTGFLLDDQEIGQSIHGQRGDAVEKDYQAFTAGLRSGYRLRFHALGREHAVEAGLYTRYDHTLPRVLRLRFGTQIPYLVDLDQQSDVVNVAGYLDVDLHPLSFLTLRGGLRQESFTYGVVDRCATAGNFRTGQPLDVNCPDYDRAGPRLPSRQVTATGQVLEPRGTALVALPAGLTASASAGVGAQSLEPISIQQEERAPFVKLTAYEVGLLGRWRVGSLDVSARATGYQTLLGRDLVFNPDLGRLAPSSATTRTGVVGAVRVTSGILDTSASVTTVHPVFDDDGSLVPYTPLLVARSDTALTGPLFGTAIAGHPLFGEGGLSLGYVGKRSLPLGKFSEPTFQVDASAAVRWQAIKLGISVQNLFDTQFPLSEFFYASDFHTRPYPTLAPAEHFTAAPPRIGLLTLTVLLDREGE